MLKNFTKTKSNPEIWAEIQIICPTKMKSRYFIYLRNHLPSITFLLLCPFCQMELSNLSSPSWLFVCLSRYSSLQHNPQLFAQPFNQRKRRQFATFVYLHKTFVFATQTVIPQKLALTVPRCPHHHS